MYRATRFHTETGEFCGFPASFGIGMAVVTYILSRIRKRWLSQPWWVFEAIRLVDSKLNNQDRVLELGSGYSTLWFCNRVEYICSIEESEAWKTWLEREMAARRQKIKGAVLLGNTKSFLERLRGGQWSVIVIDGSDRMSALDGVISLQRENLPRILIFDDTDKAEYRGVARLVQSLGLYSLFVFRGFKPQTLHACETTVAIRKDRL
ncbi:hypothetical protein [Methylacidiphilum sp. Yel]|uniref:hypothetical protein n=1 Tax=Methylacidiphilum sp. Yel TaxID=1847730 RepID=UPI00106A9B8E|nr:hypothetical protein [Methylacidiphilum sp. Yel]